MQLNRVKRVHDRVPLRNALISVADKSGLEAFMRRLWDLVPDLTVYSTGGTCSLLREVATDLRRGEECVRPIPSYTGQPEMQGGLVKTLDYRIYLGLLSEDFNPDHQTDLERTNSIAFDLTVCSFYPFEEAARAGEATLEDLRTHIDIGGPAMVRASAKNYLRVLPLCNPRDYDATLEELERHGGSTSLDFRLAMALKAFQYTAEYDASIAAHLTRVAGATDTHSLYDTEGEIRS